MNKPSARLDIPKPPSDFTSFKIVMKSGAVFNIGARESEIEQLKQKMNKREPGLVELNRGRYPVLSEEVAMLIF
ncbi:hypothetical protein [Paenibacillus tianjinensis]|uniref:Uncharacterized protein n=1 Tax=Paenibacillus tianjinensis TaxID=2810347 RepID=A0ABX7LAD6_9BACL|nr:hypothetical protein [Paenibacillus tianjinensis]QSF43405.1 hypothetical protein JRJ22_19255 [Paenibacillus tianjinensis]